MHQEPEFARQITTIERFILDQQESYPAATGALTHVLYDIALAAKIIASRTTRAGLVGILGSTGKENVQGEQVQKLDQFAQRTIYRLNDHTGRLAVMASEEEEKPIPIPERFPAGNYVLVFDPLDGSSNIDFNVSIGTIFAIYRRKTPDGTRGTLEDCLQAGRDLVAAGYIVYGSSTMFVYSTGHGVHGFTLDPSIGEFLLSHPDIRFPAKPKYYSANLGYTRRWSPGVQRYTRWLQGEEAGGPGLSLRYIGSLVADFHRNLLTGGVFYYPADGDPTGSDPTGSRASSKPRGKLRLLYEAAPLSFLAEQAGGYGSDGSGSILDLEPESLHERVPLYVGSRALVEKAEAMIREEG